MIIWVYSCFHETLTIFSQLSIHRGFFKENKHVLCPNFIETILKRNIFTKMFNKTSSPLLPFRPFIIMSILQEWREALQYCQMFYFTVLLDDTFSKKCHIGICANFEIPSWSRRNPTGLLVSSSLPFSSLRLVFLFG